MRRRGGETSAHAGVRTALGLCALLFAPLPLNRFYWPLTPSAQQLLAGWWLAWALMMLRALMALRTRLLISLRLSEAVAWERRASQCTQAGHLELFACIVTSPGAALLRLP